MPKVDNTASFFKQRHANDKHVYEGPLYGS